MKNKRFWITASILAVIIIVAVMVLRLGGKKLKVKDSESEGRIWIFSIGEDGKAKREHFYDNSLRYIITPYNYTAKGYDYDYNGKTYHYDSAIPIKAIGWEPTEGNIKRQYIKKGFYIDEVFLEI